MQLVDVLGLGSRSRLSFFGAMLPSSAPFLDELPLEMLRDLKKTLMAPFLSRQQFYSTRAASSLSGRK